MTKSTVFLSGLATGALTVGILHESSLRAEYRQTTATDPSVNAVDSSKTALIYANTFRLSASPDDLVLDLGANLPPVFDPGSEGQVFYLGGRVSMSYATAAKLNAALDKALKTRGQPAEGTSGTAPTK